MHFKGMLDDRNDGRGKYRAQEGEKNILLRIPNHGIYRQK